MRGDLHGGLGGGRGRALGVALGVALGAVAASTTAHAQCLEGGDVNFCEDPVTGTWNGSAPIGGSSVAEVGWRVDELGDRINYDLGSTVNRGAVRFAVSGISLGALSADQHLLLILSDVPDILAQPTTSHSIEIKIWGSAADPNQVGTLALTAAYVPPGQSTIAGDNWTLLGWDPGETYVLDVAWDEATQDVTLTRNGADSLAVHVGGDDSGELRYRYLHLAPDVPGPEFDSVVGSVYELVSLAAYRLEGQGGAGGVGGSAGGAGGGGTSSTGGASAGGLPDGEPAVTDHGDESGCGCRLSATTSSVRPWRLTPLWLLLAVGFGSRMTPSGRRSARTEGSQP